MEHEVAAALAELKTEVKHITSLIVEQKATFKDYSKRLDDLEKKPAKRWETIVTQIITAIVAAGIGYFISKFGV